MKDKILDIWAIQNNPEELFSALKNITTDDVVIFKNLICKFKIGKKTCSRQFDNLIYSEESDTAVFFMRDGAAKIEQAEKYFAENNVKYSIVSFIDNSHKFKDNEEKEFWFARSEDVLEDAVLDSACKNDKSCRYYPNVKSTIIFKHLIENYNSFENKVYGTVPIIKVSFRGLIEFGDKYILPTLSQWQKNLHKNEILAILNKNNIAVEVVENDEKELTFA